MDTVSEPTQNYGTGYIKLYRSLSNKGWYKKSDYLHLWIHLLLKANHRDNEFFWNGKNINVKSGQFITGRTKLALETGINESKIERILTFFEKSEQQIEQQKSNTSRLITITYWHDYQISEQRFEQRVNNDCTTAEQRVNTNKNDNNDNNEKNGDINKLWIGCFKRNPSIVEYEKTSELITKHSFEIIEKAFRKASLGNVSSLATLEKRLDDKGYYLDYEEYKKSKESEKIREF